MNKTPLKLQKKIAFTRSLVFLFIIYLFSFSQVSAGRDHIIVAVYRSTTIDTDCSMCLEIVVMSIEVISLTSVITSEKLLHLHSRTIILIRTSFND